ncbi:MAG: 3-dehydro-L-gulonate 2-dehydrogenase [Fusobacteriaceae bacterium]|jgi:3-dehydro-L-gulonate 2-dehydrogenase|nr:3-dehydro-L-gulonate 2-dehydrogenase [Fusobacteriaceae bacterium]
MRLSFEEIKKEIKRVFLKYGVPEEKAEICARIHTESTNDGIYSHGTGRVARFVDYIKKGWVDVHAEPVIVKEEGALCILDGNLGIGITNALTAADKGMELAKKYGVGLVGLRNTTHWMRGGSYGLYAANKGFIAFMWTNTESIMPPWGGKEVRLGNNPVVMAVPRKKGESPLMMDMAVSQYAYGKLAMTRLAGKKLPFPGGYDKNGVLTDDPGAIEESQRILPMGYWKGSTFSFMLDILAAVLSDGLGAVDLDHNGKGSCGGASQVMILMDPSKTKSLPEMETFIERSVAHLKSAALSENSTGILAPGDDYVHFREEHAKLGIFVEDVIWNEILAL